MLPFIWLRGSGWKRMLGPLWLDNPSTAKCTSSFGLCVSGFETHSLLVNSTSVKTCLCPVCGCVTVLLFLWQHITRGIICLWNQGHTFVYHFHICIEDTSFFTVHNYNIVLHHEQSCGMAQYKSNDWLIELGCMLFLNINRKWYMGSPFVRLRLTLVTLKVNVNVNQILKAYIS